MLRIIDHRQTGKTTKLIEEAVKDKAILVVPNYRYIPSIELLMKKMYPDEEERPYLEIMVFHDFLKCRGMKYDHDKYYIDELDACLQTVGVLGYSISTEEENQNGSEI